MIRRVIPGSNIFLSVFPALSGLQSDYPTLINCAVWASGAVRIAAAGDWE
jgi:hypothetical protein